MLIPEYYNATKEPLRNQQKPPASTVAGRFNGQVAYTFFKKMQKM